MISTRMAGLFAGIALATGLVVGAAGAIVAREAGTPAAGSADWAGHMQTMNSMMAGSGGMMGGSGGMMGGSGGMMGGSGGMMGGSGGMGPGMMGSDASSTFDWMRQHHGATPPQVTP